MSTIKPLVGWALDTVVKLDGHWPGAAGAFLRASDERRQVVAALLSSKPIPADPRTAGAFAEFVSRADHRAILCMAYGDVPIGLRGALGRAGHQPHEPRFYTYLHHVLLRPRHPRMMTVIAQLESIDMTRLRIASRLPEDLCTLGIVRVIDSLAMARDINALINLLIANGIDRAALVESLGRVSTGRQLRGLWQRWALKAVFPSHPLAECACYIPVRCGKELRQLARRYRNCAERYIVAALDGRTAFGEFVWGSKRAVIELKRRDKHWVLENVHGRDNGIVRSELRAAAISFLAEHGVAERPRDRPIPGEWDVLTRLAGLRYFDFEDYE